MQKRTQSVYNELKRIREQDRNGLLRPEAVVKAARNPDSPLHSRFEWDDGKAAHQYRIQQARELIVSITIFVDEERESPIPAFVSLARDRIKGGGGYRPSETVFSDPQLRNEILETALSELEVFQERYKRFKELAAIFSATRKLQKRIGHAKTK